MKTKKRRILAFLLAALLFAAMCCEIVFADAKSDFRTGITKAYGVLRAVATAGGVLALAGCGVVLLTGSEKDGEKVKTAVRYIIVAIAGVWLMPLIIRFGKGMFGNSWNPHSLGKP